MFKFRTVSSCGRQSLELKLLLFVKLLRLNKSLGEMLVNSGYRVAVTGVTCGYNYAGSPDRGT